jgi:drug/metabolite transporter (DMT)-like permease
MASSSIRKGSLLAVVAAVAFGATTPLIRLAGRGAGPLPTATLLYAGALLASVLAPREGAAREAPLRRGHAPRLVAIAMLGAIVAPACLAWGLRRTSAMAASLLLNVEAVFTVILGWRLYHEPIGRRVGVALACMLAGAALLVVTANGESASIGIGVGAIAVVLATLAWSLDNAVTRSLADFDPTEVIRWKSGLGATGSALMALALAERFPSPVAALGLLTCGAVGYGLSLRFYLLAQRFIGAGRTGSIFAAAPFVGVVVAVAMGERGGGAAIVIAGALFAVGVYLHVTEDHGHRHEHEAMEHEHSHRHDDGHHDHVHAEVVVGEHSHPHRHEPRTHEHPHGPDIHHQHRHS